MFQKFVVLFAVVVAANAGGYVGGYAGGYAGGYPGGFAAPGIGFAAPAISRIEHLPTAVASSYKTDVFTAPTARTFQIAPATVHTVQPAPLIAAPAIHAAPLLRAGHFGHGYAAAPISHFGGYAGHFGAGPLLARGAGFGYGAGFGHGVGFGYGSGFGYGGGFGYGLSHGLKHHY